MYSTYVSALHNMANGFDCTLVLSLSDNEEFLIAWAACHMGQGQTEKGLKPENYHGTTEVCLVPLTVLPLN